MNLDKAIFILTDIQHGITEPTLPDEKKAIELGIEALRRVRYSRYDSTKDQKALLPGETED